jgi:hypothetical protein
MGGRIGALAGLAFAALFFFGTASLDIPHGLSDDKIVTWWSDSGNRHTAVISMYCFALAGLCFLAFLVPLRSRLRAAEGGDGALTSLVMASGAVFVAMLMLAAVSRGLIGFATSSPASDESLPGPDTLRYLPHIGTTALGVCGLPAAALAIATTSWLAVRTAVFPRWHAWVGAAAALLIIVASAALSGVLAIPALLVWALATSFVMWRGTR